MGGWTAGSRLNLVLPMYVNTIQTAFMDYRVLLLFPDQPNGPHVLSMDQTGGNITRLAISCALQRKNGNLKADLVDTKT